MDEILKHLKKSGFTRDQIDEIKEGIEEGLDVTCYTRNEFLAIQMRQIRLGLEQGMNLSTYKHLDAGVLKQMRLAVLGKINIVPYIVGGDDAEQLEAIREAMEKEIDLSSCTGIDLKGFRGISLHEIFTGLEHGLNVSVYAKTEYNWQQMREIRLGMEYMIDIEQYTNPYLSWRQMRKIRLGLEEGLDVSYYRSPMYTAQEMEKRRIRLEENPSMMFTTESEITEAQEETWEEAFISQHYSISISPDEMEAYIEVHGATSEFDRTDIVRLLHKKGICYGIRYEVIDSVVSGNSFRKPLLIAEGRKARDGQDGWYEYFFRTQIARTPKQLADGNVDYRSVEWFETVEKGQKLAYYHNAQKGENGTTITGKVLPAKRGREQSILTGKGFKRLADGKTYISEMQGIVTLQDFVLNVSRLLVMKEVNLATGDVEFAGSVLVEGNVNSGATIKATEDVMVKGFVEAAKIICGGNVFLQQGMNASGNGSINALKDVIGYFFESADVYAGGNIQGDYFLNSNLHAEGKVNVTGKKGMLVGGMVWAERGMKVNSLGNQSGLPTYVKLGNIERILQKEKDLNETFSSVKQELVALQSAHAEFQRKGQL